MENPQKTNLGLVIVVLAALMLSTKGLFAKFAYMEGLSVASLLSLRSLLGIPILFLWALYKPGWAAFREVPPRQVLWMALVGVLGYFCAPMFDFWALTMIDVGVERVLLFAYPAFVVLLQAAKDKTLPSLRQILALVLTQVGIFLTVGGFDPAMLRDNLTGALLALAAGLCWGSFMVISQSNSQRWGSVRATFWSFSGGGLVFILVQALGLSGDPLSLDIGLRAWMIVVAMTLFSVTIPFVMYIEAIRLIGATRTALVSTIGPPATVVLAYFLLNEQMAAGQILGMAIVITGVLVLEGRLPQFSFKRERA